MIYPASSLQEKRTRREKNVTFGLAENDII